MAIEYSLFKFHKGKPRELHKIERTREADRVERECRAKVDARDQRQCFYPRCRVRASDKHHIQPRSLGGTWTTANIASACRRHHDWFKAGLITVDGNPNRGPLRVLVTALGTQAGIRVPERKAVA